MPKNENRLNRIDEELKKELSQIISYELKNPEAISFPYHRKNRYRKHHNLNLSTKETTLYLVLHDLRFHHRSILFFS